jgi:ABC-type antimicrobial peptide transport system permease subunit
MPRNLALLVRSSAPLETLVPAIRRLVFGLDPSVPIYDVQAMSAVVDASMAKLQLLFVLMSAAAIMTLVLASVGLYGLIAYLVARRTREFGIRIALGATPARIARLVAMRGLVLTFVGVAAGFALYAFVAPLLRAYLFGVTLDDPGTLLGCTLLLAGAAALASGAPAWQAARVEAAKALRAE